MSSGLKQLKFKTSLWATKWANSNEKSEETPVDLPGLINILQSLGFYIRCSDVGINEEEKSNANDNQKGITVSLTCNHSGQTFRLEKLTSENACQCAKAQDDNYRDVFWEITATKPSNNLSSSVLETGSDLVPALSKDMNQVVSDISNHLLTIINKARENKSTDSKIKQTKQFSKSSENLFKVPSVVVTSTRMSLDALLSGPISPDRSIAELKRFESHSALDPNYSTDKLLCNNPEVSSKIISLMKTAHSALSEALSLGDHSFLNCSNDSVFSSSTNIQEQAKSLERLDLGISSRAASSPAIILSPVQQKKNVKPKTFQLLPKASSVTSLKKSVERRGSTATNVSSQPRTISKSSSSLYAHVKSTIPKMSKKK